jgi:hypothetical protein
VVDVSRAAPTDKERHVKTRTATTVAIAVAMMAAATLFAADPPAPRNEPLPLVPFH